MTTSGPRAAPPPPALSFAGFEPAPQPPLGELLVEAGLVTRDQVREALELQAQTGERIGRVLTALGHVRRVDLCRLLARQQGLDVVELREADPALLRILPEEWMRQKQAMPYRMVGPTVVLAMVDPLDLDALREAGAMLGRPVRRAVTSDLDVMWCLQKHYRSFHLDSSIRQLYDRASSECANEVMTRRQFGFIAAGLVAVLAWLLLHWLSALIALNAAISLIYFFSTSFRFAMSIQGVRRGFRLRITPEEVAAVEDRDCPVYTILVPVFREPQVMPALMSGIRNLDYPKSKLDVKILFEESDPETLEAAKQVKPEAYVNFVVVPESLPKTKPKACNYGLLFARGEYLVIYDAEDIPEPDQIKKAVVAFRKAADPALVCIQAALNYFNTDYNLLTRWFTLEYAFWFNFFLPGLDRLGGIIPLGGTSNHFVTEKLRELSAWDPYNVTEDADLGVRLAARGYKTAVLNSTTFEEANSRVGNWLRQRSRWIKGYMQTYLVHMRTPLALARKVGWKNWWLFQFTVGTTFLLPLVNPIMWMVFLWWLVARPYILDMIFPWPVLYLAQVTFLFGNFLFAYFALVPALALRKPNLVGAALLIPAYWVLMSMAAYKALQELIIRPFYWQKTTHGLTRTPTAADALAGGMSASRQTAEESAPGAPADLTASRWQHVE